MDRNVPALFALSVALLLVTTPVFPVAHAGQPEYTHYIEQVPANEVPAEADVVQYDALSAEAKAAIQDARTDDGSVYGEANKPSEFFYSDHAVLNNGIYYIQQDGTHYRLMTFAGGGVGLFSINLLLQWGLVLLGVSIGLLGYVSLRDRRQWLPTGVGVFGGLVLLGAVFKANYGTVIGEDSGLLPLLLLVLALGGIVTALVAFGVTAQRKLVRRTAIVFAILIAVGSGLWLLRLTPLDGLLDGLLQAPLPIVLFVLVLGLTLITAGYLGQLAYHRVGG